MCVERLTLNYAKRGAGGMARGQSGSFSCGRGTFRGETGGTRRLGRQNTVQERRGVVLPRRTDDPERGKMDGCAVRKPRPLRRCASEGGRMLLEWRAGVHTAMEVLVIEDAG